MKKTLAAIAAFAAGTAALAQEGAVQEGASLTLKSIITRGGGIMYVLVALSVVAVMLIIYYLLSLRPSVLCPAKFLHAAQDAASSGDLGGLQELCAKEQSAAGRILLAACARHDAGSAVAADHEAMLKALEDEGARQVSGIWGQLQYLMDVGGIAPMVGLLGTVWGMMVSFSGLESGLNMINKADRLASGVSQAMFTTFGGLIIGIASMVAYALFRGRLNRLVGLLETECAGVLRRYVQATAARQDGASEAK